MVEQFTAFRASDGSTHDNEWLAYKRELYLWLRANGLDNEGIAQGVVRKVDEGRPDTLSALLEIVTGLIEHAPPPPPVAAEPEQPASAEPEYGAAARQGFEVLGLVEPSTPLCPETTA